MSNLHDRGSPQQSRTLRDVRNSSILQPEITSTPLNALGMTRATGSLVTPTRKFFGPRRYALSSNGNLSPMKIIKDPPGPLLTNTSYNLNVSTYIDTKSSGFTSRLVQYNEENPRNVQHTHQEKYGSPGLFPIVHLFKKDVPVISPKPKKMTLRIGTPDLKSQYSQEHNRLLLEGIVRSNSVIKGHNHGNEESTRSVLDALKEISRKRIHAGEEYEVLDEANKKLRRESLNGEGDTSKRNRIDSPTSESSVSPPSRQPTKKLRTIDAVLASKTSSMYANYDTGTKRKTVEDVKLKISPVNKKKFSDAETQTKVVVSTQNKESKEETTAKVPEQKQDIIAASSTKESVPQPPKQVLKIFDDKPLEIIRKNRLGALLSALTGHKIPPIPMEDRRKALDQDWPSQASNKKLTGILSPQNKQKSTEKHVTFNIPDSSSTTKPDGLNNDSINKNSIDIGNSSEITLTQAGQLNTDNIKKSETPQKEQILPKTIDSANGVSEKQSLPALVSEKTNIETTIPMLNKPTVGGFKFDLNQTIVSPKFDKNPNLIKTNLTTPSAKLIDAPQSNMPSSTVTTTCSFSTSPNFFPPMSKSSDSTQLIPKFSSPNHIPKNNSSSPINSLGLPTSLTQVSNIPAFGNKLSSTMSFSRSPSKADPMVMNKNETTSQVFSFGSSGAGQAALKLNTFSDLKSVQKPDELQKIANSSIDVSAGTFSFDTSKPSAASPITNNLNSNTSVTTASSKMPSFNAMTTCSFGSTSSSISTSIPKNLFDATTAGSVLGLPSSSSLTSPKFGNTVTTSNSNSLGFKFSSDSATVTSNSSSLGFNMKTSTTPTNAQVGLMNFQSQPANVSLSSKVTASNDSANTNGKPNNTMFGNSLKSFGTSSAMNNTFGAEAKPFAFGGGQGFNSPSTTASFSLGVPKTTSATSKAPFGTTTSTSNVPFGSATNSFGTPNPNSNVFSPVGGNIFGQTNPTPSFAGNAPPNFGTTTTTAPSFGSSTVTSFSTSNNSAFDKTNTPAFGVPNTTTSSIFGSNNNQLFGSTNNTTSGFGSATAFGNANTSSTLAFATNTPTFGTSTTTSVFGTVNSPTFGSSSTTPAFGTTNASSFGSLNTPSFGTSNTASFGTTNTPSFGTTNTPSFGTANTSTFGNSNVPSFGSTNVPTFGSTKSPSFGSSGSFSAVPSFGTASTPFGNPVTTSSNSFGNAVTTTSSAFGSPSTTLPNTFNSPNTMVPFGSSATNSFGAFNSASSPFNTVTTASGFGTNSNNTFGASNAANNAFGGSSGTNAFSFGGPSNNNGNGITPAKNTFGPSFGATTPKPELTSGVFPTQNNSFGNTSNYNFSQNTNNSTNNNAAGGVFTFGSPNAQPSVSTGVFAFGNAETPKTFSFSAPGTSATGQAPSNMFQPSPSFGQSNAMPNMFSIGSGTSTQNRARARAKKRT